MLTKVGSELVKEALLGAIAGGIRANNLTRDEKEILTRYYGLDPDASLGWRNAGRGLIGGLIGRIPGNIIAGKGLADGNPRMAAVGRAASIVGP